MPKIVDRTARRQEIVDAYLELVAGEGMEAATTRRLADRLNVASGSFWHYFENFDEVLQEAFKATFDRTNARIEDAAPSATGLAAVRAMIEQAHPLDKTTRDEALIVVNFWGRVAAHESLSVYQARIVAEWHAAYRLHLEQAVGEGDLSDDTPVSDIADVLLTFITAFQVEYALRTELAEPDRQWRIIKTVLNPWLTPSGVEKLPANVAR